MKRSDVVVVDCDTTAGSFAIELHPEWAPLGAQRVADLVSAGWFDGVTLNRVNPQFLVQFGIRPPDLTPHISREAFPSLRDDPKRHSNPAFTDGVVSFAGSGPDSRLAQIFITYGSQPGLGRAPWEVPVGIVPPEDMHVVRRFYSAYGDMPPWGHGPAPQTMQAPGGQTYLDTQFPMLTKINTCRVATPTPPTSMSGNAPSKSTSMLIGKDVGLLRSGHRDVTPVRRFERLKETMSYYSTDPLHIAFWVGVLVLFLYVFRMGRGFTKTI